ncbi:MAG: hypothetical protein R3C17_17180 [Planctomycetaceae bacterium]
MHHDSTTNGPERFLGFYAYSVMRDVDTSATRPDRYIFGQNNTFENATGDDLIANPSFDPLFEDPLESIFDPDLADRDFDRIFGPHDLFALHLTSADIASSPDDVSLRVKELAPYALDDVNPPFAFTEGTTPGVRSRFTTISNSLHRFMMRTNSPHRAWEFTADSDNDGLFEFPPAFGTTAATGLPFSATDPFRPQVRRVMTIESGEGRSLVGQMPISPNHILDVERNTQTPAEGTPEFLNYMQRAGMRFRPLIDHPLATDTPPVASPMPVWTSAPVAFPPQTPTEREFWARRDRQKLARDIYVLLYTIGGAGQDAGGITRNYTTINDPSLPEGDSLYTHDQLRRMAQFAVNLVDAMDSDNVMTKFEYDKNLGNGWNMDDDPYATLAVNATLGHNEDAPVAAATANGLYPEDGLERGVVWGVEAQELAISETLGIHSNNPSMDHVATPFPDAAMARDFLYVELQNLRPMPLTLGQANSLTADTAVWRLGRYDRDAAGAVVDSAAAPDEEIAILQHAQNVVDGGGRFSISVAVTRVWHQAFFVDTGDATAGTFDGTFELIAPDADGVTLPTPNVNGSTDPRIRAAH